MVDDTQTFDEVEEDIIAELEDKSYFANDDGIWEEYNPVIVEDGRL
ncbi:MAG: hypothetical protein UW94_C0015G0008 [Parcubacteria group bacterium GW2011_GWA2_45_14]|nr:MAG: hypothetical protein UW94_C0015G0008 [Parcubacteria group bacterium GW2011_GWA2_45_14]